MDVDRRLIPYAEVDRRLSRTDLFNLETLECVAVIKIHDPDQVYIRNGCILMHTGGSRRCSTI